VKLNIKLIGIAFITLGITYCAWVLICSLNAKMFAVSYPSKKCIALKEEFVKNYPVDKLLPHKLIVRKNNAVLLCGKIFRSKHSYCIKENNRNSKPYCLSIKAIKHVERYKK